MTAGNVATRHLYVTRHGEATADETTLTDTGRRQAVSLAHRLRAIPLSVIHHGPLPRAEQTARRISAELGNVPLTSCEAAGDYVPYVPTSAELPRGTQERMAPFLAQFSDDDRVRGSQLAQRALELFTGPVAGAEDRHELVVTHNFLAGWLVRAALGAPAWRWLSLSHGNGALTVIRYAPDRPASLVVYNDMAHLSPDLAWTGVPAEQRV